MLNELPGNPSLPPGVSLRDIDPPERRREDAEDEAWERDYWLYASERREREESQRGNDNDL